MTFKKILILTLILTALPVSARESVNKLDYLNLDWWKNYNDEILIDHLQTLYKNNHDLNL